MVLGSTLFALKISSLCLTLFTIKLFGFSAGAYGEVLMDDTVCKGKELQYCYQYLRRVERGISLDAFKAKPTKPEGTPKDCLPVLMK